MDVTKPIPAKRIVNVIEDPMCLDITCMDLPTVMQEIVSQLCNTELPSLDFKCLTTVVTVPDFYQLIIDKLCESDTVTIVEEPTYELCKLDGWNCDNNCLIVTNPCGDVTQEDVIQALIARVNDYSSIICDLSTRIDALEKETESLQLQIASVQNCCD